MIKHYYLIFSETDIWYAKFLKPSFCHVKIFWHYSDGIYLGLEFSKGLFITTKKALSKPMPHEHWLRVDIETDKIKKPFFPLTLGFLNCVTITKLVLGIKSFSLTPYQLFKFLVRDIPRAKTKNNQILKVEVI